MKLLGFGPLEEDRRGCESGGSDDECKEVDGLSGLKFEVFSLSTIFDLMDLEEKKSVEKIQPFK